MLALLCAGLPPAFSRGVTPYLPLNLDPQIEREVERVMALGDVPIISRPIPAARVMDALPRACARDAALCSRVRRYLKRLMRDTGVEFASVSAAATHGSDPALPNQHGEGAHSHWEAAGAGYIQPSDYALLALGAVAYEGRSTPTGTVLSLGFDRAQLDIGYRDHWWSPLTDSAMLISTEAPTMPSVTLSNYEPLTRLGLHYEAFLARMSYSRRIELAGSGALTSGYPKFAGARLAIEPAGTGWSLAANRILVFGGGAAGGQSLTDILRAFFNPQQAQTQGFGSTRGVIGKQEASLTSSFIYPGPVPFTVYFEYAGNDTARGHNYLLGKPDLSVGIHFPRLGRFDLTSELSEWQPTWYVHSFSAVQSGYGEGITNDLRSIGHWFGDQRLTGDAVGGQSVMMRLGWEPAFGGRAELQVRTLANDSFYSAVPYRREWVGTLSYARPWGDYAIGAQLDEGRDVFGGRFTRIGAFLRYGDALTRGGAGDEEEGAAGADVEHRKDAELFVDAGVNGNRVLRDILATEPRVQSGTRAGAHLGVGARRRVSAHQDLGVRLEADDIQGRSLISVRAIDYRYRFGGPLAVGAFFGASRYAAPTPAFGYWTGAGVQWRNIVRGWDLGVDYRVAIKAQRNRVLPTDPQGGYRETAFYDIDTVSFYVSRHF